MRKPSSSAGSRSLRSRAGGIVLAGVMLALSGVGVVAVSAAAGQIMKLQTSDNGSTFYVGRCFRMNVRAQTDSLDANSVDVIIPYNTSYLAPYTNSGCTVAATQILTDAAFPSYPANAITAGRIEFTGYDPSGSASLNTGAAPADKVIAHIFWKVLASSGSFKIPFDYTQGLTTDTNMAENNGNGSDVLDAVETLTLNLSADAAAPTFTSLSPSDGATNVAVTSDLSYVFSDAGAGVNTGSLVTAVNGVTYNETFSGCTRTNTNRIPACNAAVNLPTLSYNTLYRVTATGGDLASPTTNTGSQFWSFTTEDDDDAPYVENRSPANGATGVAVSSNIVFRIKDYKNNGGVTAGLGVDISTVTVEVDDGVTAVTYDSSDPEFTYSGTGENYLVTINPPSNFAENTLVTVTVNGSDLHSPPNVMSADTYSFRTVDTGGPTITGFSPAQSATGVSPSANVSFRVTDNGAGVDIANTSITIEGVTYTQASGQWSATGSAADYTITVNPSANFSGGQTVDVAISTRDLASPTPNTASASYSFLITSGCPTCFVDSEDPARFSTGATLDNTVSFRIKDTGAGIDDDSIRITLIGRGAAFTVNPLQLTASSPQVSVTGSPSNYLVTVTLTSAIEPDVPHAIVIDASDTDSLDMDTVAYGFAFLTGSGYVIGSGGSSSAVSCPACNCPATTASTEPSNGGGGGTRRPVQREVPIIPSAQLPVIIQRRVIPQLNRVVEVRLTPEEAANVAECYVDEQGHAAPAKTPYKDVEAGAWYEDAVAALADAGGLDTTQAYFRAGDNALRAEFAKLLTALKGIAPVPPEVPSFDDAPAGTWFYPYVEAAAMHGWMLGDRDCYGTRPCITMPLRTTTRAEAAAMIVRYYGLEPNGLSKPFADIAPDAWYADEMAVAADACVVQGDAMTGLAAPGRLITRAEMAVMLFRAGSALTYGTDCGEKLSAMSPAADTGGSMLGASLLASTTDMISGGRTLEEAMQPPSGQAGSLLGGARLGLGTLSLLAILGSAVFLAYLGKIISVREEARRSPSGKQDL